MKSNINQLIIAEVIGLVMRGYLVKQASSEVVDLPKVGVADL